MSNRKDFLLLQKVNTKNEITLMSKLRKDNALKEKSLIGEYWNAFRSIKKRLSEDVQPGSDRENALSDIMDILQSASIEGKHISEIFPDGTDIFCDDLLEAMPIYTAESKQSMKTKKNVLVLFLSFMLVAVIASVAIWYFGIWGIHTKGISYFAGNEKFTYSGTPVDEEFSVLIDLSDPESNIGKVLYDAEGCTIVVSFIDLQVVNGGGYRIGFRCHGKYSGNGALLISGSNYAAVTPQNYIIAFTANMSAEYEGVLYQSEIMGTDSLLNKDGDAFYFYIFPGIAFENNEISITEKGTVLITVSDLTRNIWSRKI